MSTSRLQFSQVIPKLREDEATWFARYIEARHRGVDLDGEPHDYDENSFFPDFKFAIKVTAEEWGTYAWFYSENSASVMQVAEVVQEFLKRFRRNDCFILTWAEWDPQPRVGQFDGGAIFVTIDEIDTFHAGEWAHNREKNFKATAPKKVRRIVSPRSQ